MRGSGRHLALAGPSATLMYAYNARDQLVTETTQPAGRTSAWTVSRSYDGVENPTKFTCPGGSAYHYVRDALNRITAVQNATKQNLVSYSHDPLSRMTRADRQSGARSTASFDEVSRPLAIAHKQSATATSSLLSLSYVWDTTGQIISLTDDLGVTSYSYDKTYRLTGAAAPATAPYPDRTFAYGAAGNRSSVVATPQTAPATTPPPAPMPAPSPPTGSAAGTAGAGASEAETSADPPAAPPSPAPTTPPTPSPTPTAPAATTTAYTANNLNQYTRVGTATPTYDKNGNPTSDGTITYRWDAENRLTGATVPGAAGAAATTASYSYDAHHRRVKKTVGTTTTYFLWSGDTLLAEYSGSGTLQRRYLYAEGFAPVQVHDITGTAAAVYDVHIDHLDTPRLLTNSTGTTVWTSHHRAFGKAHTATDPDGDSTHVTFPIRFPGQYEDAETGLHYNWHRYYNPSIGRYLSTDPLGQWGGVNLYRYGFNGPMRFFDPNGRDVLERFDAVFSAGPYDALRAGTSIRDQAMKMAEDSGLPGASGGQRDAFRHCVWSCEMTKQINKQDAKDIGDAHEAAGDRRGQDPADRAMDEKNNEVGRDCGANNSKDCSVSCMDRLSEGELFGPGGKPMPAPSPASQPPLNPGPGDYY